MADNIYGYDDSDTALPLYSQMYGIAPTANDQEQIIRDERLKKLAANKLSKQARLGFDVDKTLQQNLSDAVDAQIYTRPDGSLYTIDYQPTVDKFGEPTVNPVEVEYTATNKFGPDVRDLYIDDTAQGNYKLGLARTDKGGYEGRYDPTKGGWAPGPEGVTTEDGALMNITLPRDYATAFEYGVHSDIDQIKNRAMGVGPKTEETQARFGSGQTEYTTPNAPMWNADYIRGEGTVTRETPLPKDPRYYTNIQPAVPQEVASPSSVENTTKAGIAGLLNTSSRLAELIGDSLETAGKWQDRFNKSNPPIEGDGVSRTIWGVQDSIAKWAMEEGKQLVDEQRKARESGLFDKAVGYDPREVQQYGEKFADRVEAGKYLEAVGGLVDPAGITAFVNSGAEMLIMANPIGLGTIMAANTNSNLNSLEEAAEKSGTTLTNEDKALSVGLSVVGTYLDRLGDKVVLGKGLPALGKTLDGMPPSIRTKVIKAYKDPLIRAATTVGAVVPKAGFEGSTEWMQTVMENKASDAALQNFSLTDKEQRQALEAFGIGMGAGGVPAAITSAKEVNDAVKKDVVTKKVRREAETRLDDVELNEAQQAKMDEFGKGSLYDLTTDERATIDELGGTNIEPVSEEGLSSEVRQEAMDINNEIEDIQTQLDTKGEAKIEGDERVELETKINRLEAKLEEVDPRYAENKEILDHAVQMMKDNNLSPGEVTANTAKLKAKLDIAGITNTVTKADREAGLKIEFDDAVRTSEVGGTKGKTFDAYDTTNETLESVVSGDYTKEVAQRLNTTNTKITESSVSHLKEDGKSQAKIKEVANKIKDAREKGIGTDELSAISKDMTDTDILRAMAIVMSNVSKNMESEKYVQDNQDIDYTRESTMLPQIGKEYLNTMGIKYAGKAETVNLASARLGKNLLEYAKTIGLVTSTQGKVPMTDMVDAQGNKIATLRQFEKSYPNKTVSEEKGKLYVLDNELRFTDSKNPNEVMDANEIGEAMNKLTNILLPTNFEPVKLEASKEVYIDNNRPPAKGQKEMIETIQSGGFYLKDGIRDILEQLLEEVGDMTLDEAFAKSDVLKDMVGVKQSHSFLTKSSEKGQTINRKNTIRNILDNLDKIPENDPYYFTYKTAINDRIHTQETMLEFQGDKRMARNVQSGGKYTTKNESEYNELVKAIGEDIGLSKDEMKAIDEAIKAGEPLPKTMITHSGTKGNEVIDKWVKLIGDRVSKNKSPLSLVDIVQLNKEMGKNNPWKAYSLIKAIYDVRSGDGTRVTTDYAVEFDMTASGVFNTLMNLSGDPRVQAVLEKILSKETDPYEILYEKVLNNTDKDTAAWKALNEEVKRLDAMNIDRRDLAKYLVMKWIYGAGENTNVGDMANDLSVDVVHKAMEYDQKAIEEINRIIEGEYTGDTIQNINKTDFNKMKAYYYDNVANKFANGLDKAFPGVKEYRNTMTEVFEALEKTGTWDGTISTAIAVMNDDKDPKHKTTIKKEKATPVMMDGTPIPVNKMFNNMTSFFVNLQHLTDAYLDHKSASETIKKFGNGIMTVHDAGYGNIRDMVFFKGTYDKESVNAALKYDYVNVALMELDSAINNMSEGVEKNRRRAQYNSLKEANDANLERKKEFLKGKTINMFGSTTATAEVNVEPEVEATKEPTVKTVSDTVKLQDIMESINSISEDAGTMDVIQKLEELEVSEEVKDLKVKVIEGLMNGVWVVGLSGKEGKTKGYGGLDNTIYVPTADTKHPVTGNPMVADEFIEVMAHEMDHALHMRYMSENMNSNEMKYLSRVVDKLRTDTSTAYSKNTTSRIEYILNPFGRISENELKTKADKNGMSVEQYTKLYSISEFVSIMRNEKSVYNEILKKEVGRKTLGSVIQKILDKIKKWVAKMSHKEVLATFTEDTEVTFKNTARALASFNQRQGIYEAAQAKGIELDPPSMAKPKGKSNYSKQQDIFKDATMNPDKYAKAVVARSNAFLSDMITVWGSAAINIASPIVGGAHGKLKKNSDIYRKTTGYLRYGFVDSNTAQSMRRMFTVQSDVDENLLGDMLTLGTNIISEVNDYRTENLPDLAKRLAKIIKPEDQEAVYLMFSRTALSGIRHNKEIVKGLINSDMTMEEAYKLASQGISKEDMAKIEDLASQYVTGKSKNGWVNHIKAGLYDDKYKPAIAMTAMRMVKDGQAKLDKLPTEIRKELYTMALQNQHLNDEVNGIGPQGEGNLYRDDFDGTYSMDVYDENGMQFERVSKTQLLSDEFSSEKGWKLIKEPTKEMKGIVARTIIDGGKVPGVGININRYDNGVYINEEESISLKNKLDKMSKEDGDQYLIDNNIIMSGDGRRFKIILTEEEKSKAGLKKDVAESLWRTYAHNAELTMMKSVRDMITNSAIEKISTKEQLDKLNKRIAGNRGKQVDKDTLPMFIKIDYNYESYDDLPAYIRRYYVKPKNVTTYNRFNEKITLVKRGEKEVLVGHSNFNPISEDNRELRKFLYGYKKLVVMAKQKMVLTNPKKLLMDAVANTGVLLSKDVPVMDVVRGIPKNLELYNEFSKLRGEIVQLKMRARLGGKEAENKVKAAEARLRKHPFYNSYIYGHIQSYSTAMITKDFDTVSGLQKDIDDIIDSITTDKKGNPNSVHDAIKKWQNLGADNGFTVDSLFSTVSQISKVKGTSVGKELEAMSERLKTDRDADSVSRYLSQIIGGPASEAVKVGGAVMISADVISKKILAEHLVSTTNPKTRRKYTIEEAYREANSTFIDYRQNMPELIKGMSDYGVLLFPSFWMRAQKVAANLVYRHPASALSGYAIADMLDINSASFLDVNLITRIAEGRVINEPTSLIDWDIFTIF